MSSGPCLKLLTSLLSSSSTDASFFVLRFFPVRVSRNFLNTSSPLVKDAMIESTQLDTFVWDISKTLLWDSIWTG